MGDMGDFYRAWDEEKKARRNRNMQEFSPESWTKHTEYHYSKIVEGHRLDYWPSKKKWMYKGKVSTGNVAEFIAAREKEDSPI